MKDDIHKIIYYHTSDGVFFVDGFDECLVGIGSVGSKKMAVYDQSKCIKSLIRQGMSLEEANEHLRFLSGFSGDNALCLLIDRINLRNGAPEKQIPQNG